MKFATYTYQTLNDSPRKGDIVETSNSDQARDTLLAEFIRREGLPDKVLPALNIALTHKSYSNEFRAGLDPGLDRHNQRLEFLGDSVLGLVIAHHFYASKRKTAEGGLTRLKAMTVCESALKQIADTLDLGQMLRMGKGEIATGGLARTSNLADAMEALGLPGMAPEGRFYPDTYAYSKGSADLAVLKRALRAMRQRVDEAWAARAPDLPLRTPDEALTLASIVEKETGAAAERARIAAVFVNRLRIGMPLQTDPTVIYGLGEAFDGNLRKRDLQTDTPYNTYTRRGLPPTPIAMPGLASLRAAVQPAATPALYFVARGDGSSVFSADLAAHNRAVNQYQRGIQPPAARP